MSKTHPTAAAAGSDLFDLEVRAARELEEGEARAADDELVGADGGGGLEALCARRGDEVVLVNAVAADADGPDQLAVLVERHAAGEDLDAVRDVRYRGAAHVRAAQRREQVRADEVNLQPVVEDAPLRNLAAEGAGRVRVEAVRVEGARERAARAVGEGVGAVEPHAVGRRAVYVAAEARGAQQGARVAVRVEGRGARLLHRHVEAEDRRVGRAEDAEHVAVNVYDGDGHARGAPERLAYRGARDVGLLRRLVDDALHVGGRQRVRRTRTASDEGEEARVGRAADAARDSGDELRRLRGDEGRDERPRERPEGRRRRARRVGVGDVEVCEADAARDDVVAADEVGRLEAALRGDGDQLLEGLVEVGRVFVQRVEPVAFDADAADRDAVLVERRAAGVGGEPERERGPLDVAARQLRELHAEERPRGLELRGGREVLLNDEARRARRKRVALRAEDARRPGLRHGGEVRGNVEPFQALPRAPAAADARRRRRARHAERAEHVPLAVGHGD